MKKLKKLLCICLALTLVSCNTKGDDSSSSSSIVSSSSISSISSSLNSSLPDSSVSDSSSSLPDSSVSDSSSSLPDSSVIDSSSSLPDSSTSDSSSSLPDSSTSDSSSSGGNTEACSHRDTNNDDVCDKCDEPVTVTFDFFAVNDIHGKFTDGDSHPGVDELSTYLSNAKEANPNTVLFSSGDTWQGTVEAGLTKGLIFTDWMNEMDFVSMTLGNHEFDWGDSIIQENADVAEFPFLACNIFSNTTKKLMDYCQPSVLVEQSGVKIGIIGAIGDCYTSIASDFRQNFYFKTGSELTNLVKQESQKLKDQGADFIIYSLHDGYGSSSNSLKQVSDSDISSYYDASLSNGYVDLVFEGHTHQHYVLKDSKGVYHLQGGGDNDGITHAEVVINPYSDSHKVTKTEFISTSVYEHLADDPIVDELLQKYEDVLSANANLGTNRQKRNSTFMCKLVAQLYAEWGEKQWSNYDIVLGGGFLQARSPYNLYAGTVKYEDLYTLFPFNNQLVLCSIRGKDLKEKFINATKNYYIAYTKYGNTVSISDTETYYVVVDTYTSTYRYNNMTEIERYPYEFYARDLLAEYIKAGNLA